MHTHRAPDDLLTFLVLSSANVTSATEQALALRITLLGSTAADSACCQSVAAAALMHRSTAIRVAALRLLEMRGSEGALRLLRDLVSDGDTDRAVRTAAEQAYAAIEERRVPSAQSHDRWRAPSTLLRAS